MEDFREIRPLRYDGPTRRRSFKRLIVCVFVLFAVTAADRSMRTYNKVAMGTDMRNVDNHAGWGTVTAALGTIFTRQRSAYAQQAVLRGGSTGDSSLEENVNSGPQIDKLSEMMDLTNREVPDDEMAREEDDEDYDDADSVGEVVYAEDEEGATKEIGYDHKASIGSSGEDIQSLKQLSKDKSVLHNILELLLKTPDGYSVVRHLKSVLKHSGAKGIQNELKNNATIRSILLNAQSDLIGGESQKSDLPTPDDPSTYELAISTPSSLPTAPDKGDEKEGEEAEEEDANIGESKADNVALIEQELAESEAREGEVGKKDEQIEESKDDREASRQEESVVDQIVSKGADMMTNVGKIGRDESHTKQGTTHEKDELFEGDRGMGDQMVTNGDQQETIHEEGKVLEGVASEQEVVQAQGEILKSGLTEGDKDEGMITETEKVEVESKLVEDQQYITKAEGELAESEVVNGEVDQGESIVEAEGEVFGTQEEVPQDTGDVLEGKDKTLEHDIENMTGIAEDEEGSIGDQHKDAEDGEGVAELDDEIRDAEAEMPNFEGKMPEIESAMPDVEGEMAEVEDEMAEIEGEMPEVEGEMPEVEGETPDAEGEVPDMEDAEGEDQMQDEDGEMIGDDDEDLVEDGDVDEEDEIEAEEIKAEEPVDLRNLERRVSGIINERQYIRDFEREHPQIDPEDVEKLRELLGVDDEAYGRIVNTSIEDGISALKDPKNVQLTRRVGEATSTIRLVHRCVGILEANPVLKHWFLSIVKPELSITSSEVEASPEELQQAEEEIEKTAEKIEEITESQVEVTSLELQKNETSVEPELEIRKKEEEARIKINMRDEYSLFRLPWDINSATVTKDQGDFFAAVRMLPSYAKKRISRHLTPQSEEFLSLLNLIVNNALSTGAFEKEAIELSGINPDQSPSTASMQSSSQKISNASPEAHVGETFGGERANVDEFIYDTDAKSLFDAEVRVILRYAALRIAKYIHIFDRIPKYRSIFLYHHFKDSSGIRPLLPKKNKEWGVYDDVIKTYTADSDSELETNRPAEQLSEKEMEEGLKKAITQRFQITNELYHDMCEDWPAKTAGAELGISVGMYTRAMIKRQKERFSHYFDPEMQDHPIDVYLNHKSTLAHKHNLRWFFGEMDQDELKSKLYTHTGRKEIYQTPLFLQKEELLSRIALQKKYWTTRKGLKELDRKTDREKYQKDVLQQIQHEFELERDIALKQGAKNFVAHLKTVHPHDRPKLIQQLRDGGMTDNVTKDLDYEEYLHYKYLRENLLRLPPPKNDLWKYIKAGNLRETIVELKDYRNGGPDATDDNGRNALHYFAALHSHPDAITVLVDEEVPWTASDNEGNTILHYAAAYNNINMVKAIRNLKGSHFLTQMKNSNGKTPYEIAKENKGTLSLSEESMQLLDPELQKVVPLPEPNERWADAFERMGFDRDLALIALRFTRNSIELSEGILSRFSRENILQLQTKPPLPKHICASVPGPAWLDAQTEENIEQMAQLYTNKMLENVTHPVSEEQRYVLFAQVYRNLQTRARSRYATEPELEEFNKLDPFKAIAVYMGWDSMYEYSKDLMERSQFLDTEWMETQPEYQYLFNNPSKEEKLGLQREGLFKTLKSKSPRMIKAIVRRLWKLMKRYRKNANVDAMDKAMWAVKKIKEIPDASEEMKNLALQLVVEAIHPTPLNLKPLPASSGFPSIFRANTGTQAEPSLLLADD